MEKFEQRFVIKFLFIKGPTSKAIHIELEIASAATMYSLTQVRTADDDQSNCDSGPP
jgi:hypothetical protein